MEKKIKLLWDFRGPDAKQIAEHYDHHLQEFIEANKLKNDITGVENISDMYSIAFMVIDEDEFEMVRNVLKPKRGTVYEG
ncbi:MAG TPA: hypothetical protein PLC76_10470 [Saprospiraceae bacterium]|jgi:uncharacterized protein YggL (DUF469 family)|nr:MAG: hypothetical protein UZ08_BCD001002016 [Candidatus Parvibacillus calidus]MBX2937298.1 hypothetical protein [Saprospiraceae bacterium]MBK7740849.1 hypothetical protein [Candidatus Parvibacillus calidus]MBX7179072.1 hypothetical protein [Saprospiraceae bacterium]MCB0590143.1 hypothetical protein [Saprospiraceae bacterium]